MNEHPGTYVVFGPCCAAALSHRVQHKGSIPHPPETVDMEAGLLDLVQSPGGSRQGKRKNAYTCGASRCIKSTLGHEASNAMLYG